MVAVIQARMGSSRLPGKVLMPILDKPILWHIVQRLKCVAKIDDIIIATSYMKRDDPIDHFCKNQSVTCYRGNEADVLDRFYKAAVAADAKTVLRITGDCPLIDPVLIMRLIDYYHQNNLEYCGIAAGAGVATDEFYGRYPDGLDTEIFCINALKTAWQEADGILFREHVTPYLWKHPDKFKIGILKCRESDYSQFRWTLDNQEDYLVIQKIYEKLYPENESFDMRDILDLMKLHPQIFIKNQHFVGKEGYEQFWN